MSAHQHENNPRRKHNKVLTGCINCKRRHVKCDETPLGCQRCQKAGLLCVGYRPPKARIFEPTKRSQVSSSEAIVTTVVPTKAPDLRLIWQIALLDSFLVIWLPDALVSGNTTDNESSMIPMAAWPLITWKLAKRKHESFVAHSLLCLVLCTLGARTGNLSLIGEASRHYARVLHQFQSQINLLAESGYSPKQDNLVASLAAAGFCCSQVEYILQSWSNGDRHLQGMASLLQACGPLCLKHEDSRRIFYDHCLLWISCSVVHRRSSIYSQWPWEMNWTEVAKSCRPARELLMISACIPPLLEEYDTSHQHRGPVHTLDLLKRIHAVMVDLEALDLSSNPLPAATASLQLNYRTLMPVILTGYASAFLIHVVVTISKIVQSQSMDSYDFLFSPSIKEEQLRAICEYHVAKLYSSIERLADEAYGLLTASPLLFFIDSASIAYVMLAEHCSRDLSDDRTWLTQISSQLAARGYHPLRGLGKDNLGFPSGLACT